MIALIWRALGFSIAFTLPSAALTDHDPQPPAAASFACERVRPLDVQDAGRRQIGSVTVRDVTYGACDVSRGRIAAFVVSPAGVGPFAGILYFHWLGERRSDRTQFLDEAVALAERGAASVLIQGYFPWTEKPTSGAADRERIIAQVVDTRRAMDLLLSLPEIDPSRVAYVGHDYGAMFGAILAGLERRATAYVFIAPLGTFADWSLKYWPETAGSGEEAYRRAVADLDPIHYVGLAAPAALLFQFARRDIYVTEAAASELFDQASPPKEWRWYDADHALDVEAAARDRRAWLMARLRLAGG